MQISDTTAPWPPNSTPWIEPAIPTNPKGPWVPNTNPVPSMGPITNPDYGKKTSDGSSTDYYKLPPNITDLIDLIEFRNMNFAIGNIFKACYRLGQKEGNDDLYDLRKIKFFIEREIARVEKEKNNG